MRRWPALAAGALAVALAAVLGAGAAVADPAARAADPPECTGLQTCVPVKGPWVLLPAPATGAGKAAELEWELACPTQRYVIGGSAARATAPTVDVVMEGKPGSPVGAGTTTGNSMVFRGAYGGADPVPAAFRPAIGCVPTSGGGGGRSRVRYEVDYPPATQLVRHREEQQLRAGQTMQVVASCAGGGRLLHASAAIGFATGDTPPTATAMRAVALQQRIQGASIVVTARATQALLPTVKALLQVRTVCTEGFQ